MNSTLLRLLGRLAPLALVMVLWAPAVADTSSLLSDRDLSQQGVQSPATLMPVLVGPGGMVLATEDTRDRKDLSAGVFNRLWVLQYGPDSRLQSARGIPLQMPRVNQIAFTPDYRQVVLLNRAGAAWSVLDLRSQSVRPLFEPEAGKPGFVANPLVLWSQDSQTWLEGYPLDAEGIAGKTTLAALDLSGQDRPKFQPAAIDLDAIYRDLAPVVATRWISPDLGYVAHGRKGEVHLEVIRGGQPERVGTYQELSGFWAAGSRLFWTGKDSRGWVAEILDVRTGQRWHGQPSKVRLTYAFLCDDGSTAVVTESREGSDRMKVFFAREREGFQWKPLPGFQSASLGMIRLAPDGRFMSLRNDRGLHFVELPR